MVKENEVGELNLLMISVFIDMILDWGIVN